MRSIFTILIMTTVAPVAAATTLVCWNPQRWGGSVSLLNILVMAFFGLISTPLWPTYLPSIVITPLVMTRIAKLRIFKQTPLAILAGISIVLGAICGIAVLSIVVPWHESLDLILNWVTAGAVSGAIALLGILLIYRWIPSAESRTPANLGLAKPPPIPKVSHEPPQLS